MIENIQHLGSHIFIDFIMCSNYFLFFFDVKKTIEKTEKLDLIQLPEN